MLPFGISSNSHENGICPRIANVVISLSRKLWGNLLLGDPISNYLSIGPSPNIKEMKLMGIFISHDFPPNVFKRDSKMMVIPESLRYTSVFEKCQSFLSTSFQKIYYSPSAFWNTVKIHRFFCLLSLWRMASQECRSPNSINIAELMNYQDF